MFHHTIDVDKLIIITDNFTTPRRIVERIPHLDFLPAQHVLSKEFT